MYLVVATARISIAIAYITGISCFLVGESNVFLFWTGDALQTMCVHIQHSTETKQLWVVCFCKSILPHGFY